MANQILIKLMERYLFDEFSIARNMWVFPKIVVPQNGWFIMENLVKMDDLGGTLIFGNIHVCLKCSPRKLSPFFSWMSGVESSVIREAASTRSDRWSDGVWIFVFSPSDRIQHMDVSENSGFSTQIIHFSRVFHDFHHPFWGIPIFSKHPYIMVNWWFGVLVGLDSWDFPKNERECYLGNTPGIPNHRAPNHLS